MQQLEDGCAEDAEGGAGEREATAKALGERAGLAGASGADHAEHVREDQRVQGEAECAQAGGLLTASASAQPTQQLLSEEALRLHIAVDPIASAVANDAVAAGREAIE